MNKTTWASIALCAAILAGCGGDPGSSGDPGDTDPSGGNSSGSGTTTPHFVTIPVTLIAGDSTDTVAQIATVNVWRNTQATPMGTMPVAYAAYAIDPVKIDANEEDLVQVGVDVAIDGCVTAVTPMPMLSVEQLRAVEDSFPVSALVARNLTGATWSCLQTLTQNGMPLDEQTKQSSVTMSIDLSNDRWTTSISAFGVEFAILGDTVSAIDSGSPLTGTVSPDGNSFTLDIEGANADAKYVCTR